MCLSCRRSFPGPSTSLEEYLSLTCAGLNIPPQGLLRHSKLPLVCCSWIHLTKPGAFCHEEGMPPNSIALWCATDSVNHYPTNREFGMPRSKVTNRTEFFRANSTR